MERNFADDIKINKFKLDDVCEKHPGLYHYYADKLAEAKSDLNDAEDKLKLIQAEQELFIRNNWDDKNGKQTEAGVKAVLETDGKVQNQKEIVRNLQREVNTYTASVIAMDHKKAELDNLVRLLIAGFYSVPNGKDDVIEKGSIESRRKLNKEKK